MSKDPEYEITDLLLAHRQGDRTAFDRLLPLVYHQLKRLAHRQIGFQAGTPTLNTTALVHEAYEKLVDQERIPWKNRGHFLAIAARAMHQIVVDYARERSAQKRGGGAVHLPLEHETGTIEAQADQLLDLERALDRLMEGDERLARLIECRFFTGLSEVDTAEALSVSTRTVQRDWAKARAWLALHEIPLAS